MRPRNLDYYDVNSDYEYDDLHDTVEFDDEDLDLLHDPMFGGEGFFDDDNELEDEPSEDPDFED